MTRLMILLGTLTCLALPSCKYFDGPLLTPPGPTSTVEGEISPCDEGESIDIGQLPQAIIDYLDENYPNSEISDADIYQLVNNVLAYAVELEDDLEILFDESGLVISAGNSSGDDEDDIPLADLPTVITDYIAANYPTATIIEAEYENYYGTTYIEVEIDELDEQELYFTAAGVFLCVDDDDGDDDDDDDGDDDDDDGDDDDGDDYDNVPGPIADFVTANYAGFTIESVDQEELCDDVPVIEVELEGPGPDPELYFDLDYNFLFVAYDIDATGLPAAVVATLDAQYPGYSLDNDDIQRYEYPDGTIEYRVELELPGDDDDIELVLAADGTILCEED